MLPNIQEQNDNLVTTIQIMELNKIDMDPNPWKQHAGMDMVLETNPYKIE